VFGAASGSEFGVASSGGFGRNKNVFTFTLDQGAQPVSTTAEDWRGLEIIDDQDLEDLQTASQLLQEIGVLPELTTLEQKADEGYESSPSPVSNHSLEANSDTCIVDFNNLDQFSFNLIPDFPEHNDFNIFETNDHLSCGVQQPPALYNDASFPMEEQNDPDWCPASPEFTLQKIAIIDDPILHDAFMKASGGEVKEKPAAGGKKHRRGQIRMKPTEIKDETHQKNVSRCRDYRENKKAKDVDQVAELTQLEEVNNKLRMEEEELREKLEKAKKIYLELITTGRIKFV